MFLSDRKNNALRRYTIAEWEKAFSGMDCGSGGWIVEGTHPEIIEMEISDVKFTQCHPHQQQKHPISRAMPNYIYICIYIYMYTYMYIYICEPLLGMFYRIGFTS